MTPVDDIMDPLLCSVMQNPAQILNHEPSSCRATDCTHSCGHVFDRSIILEDWVGRIRESAPPQNDEERLAELLHERINNEACPLCRAPISALRDIQNDELENLVGRIQQYMTDHPEEEYVEEGRFHRNNRQAIEQILEANQGILRRSDVGRLIGMRLENFNPPSQQEERRVCDEERAEEALSPNTCCTNLGQICFLFTVVGASFLCVMKSILSLVRCMAGSSGAEEVIDS